MQSNKTHDLPPAAGRVRCRSCKMLERKICPPYLRTADDRVKGADPRPAVSLLTNQQRWERILMDRIAAAASQAGKPLKPVEWDKVMQAAYVPLWRRTLRREGSKVAGATVGSAPVFIESAVGKALAEDRDRLRAELLALAAMAISLALLDRGWTGDTSPGEEIVLRRGPDEIRPFSDLGRALRAGGSGDWAARVAALGIADLPLAEVVAMTRR